MLIEIRVMNSAPTNQMTFLLFAASGSISMNITASMVPIKMNGVRFPLLWLILSDHAPKIGSIIRAKILSRAIMAHESVSPIPKKYLSISGMILS